MSRLNKEKKGFMKRFVDLKINENIYIVGNYNNKKPYIRSRIVSYIKNNIDNYKHEDYLSKLRIITASHEEIYDISVGSFKTIHEKGNEKIFSDKKVATKYFKKSLVEYLTYLDEEARFTRNKFHKFLSE